jgi:hypothetical protein
LVASQKNTNVSNTNAPQKQKYIPFAGKMVIATNERRGKEKEQKKGLAGN